MAIHTWEGDTLCFTTPPIAGDKVTKARITGIIHRVGPGHYSEELLLGGLTDFSFIDYTPKPIPAIPTEEGWMGPFSEITDEGMEFYWLTPEGNKVYINNIKEE